MKRLALCLALASGCGERLPHAAAPERMSEELAPSAEAAAWTPAAALAVAPPERAVPEAPSPVGAVYVEPSALRTLPPGAKIGGLYRLNQTEPFVLQRLTGRSYWFQSRFTATVFYVGDRGVLLFDPPEGRTADLLVALRRVTSLPIAALAYSHDHGGHIGGAPAIAAVARAAGTPLRVIASQATATKQRRLGSPWPAATEIVTWPDGSFRFENLTVELHGFAPAAHADDAGAWLLVEEKVLHAPDLINPDQPPFWQFAISESFLSYEPNVRRLATLDWTYLCGGHGNVGSKADVAFHLTFTADLKAAVGRALAEVRWGDGLDPESVDNHAVILVSYLERVSRRASEMLRPKYGNLYGFDASTPANARMVALTLLDYPGACVSPRGAASSADSAAP